MAEGEPVNILLRPQALRYEAKEAVPEYLSSPIPGIETKAEWIQFAVSHSCLPDRSSKGCRRLPSGSGTREGPGP